jgi:prevent-host-death family protein
MTRVPITKLKAKLSEYLAAVRAGEEIIVTDRGRPVARVVPIRGARELESRVDRLVRSGVLRPPTATAPLDAAQLTETAPEDPDGRGLAALLEDRRAGR